jgi:hypothetical protein
MTLYPILAALVGIAAVSLGFAAGRAARVPCGCLVMLEPRADDWRPATAAEHGARQAMDRITFSEIEALGEIAERTFGHTWERKPL